MEEKIERLLIDIMDNDLYLVGGTEGPESIKIANIGYAAHMAAAEIAKLWSEEQDELIQDLGMERIANRICKEQCVRLEAQLVEMRGLIKRTTDKAFAHWDEDSGTPDDWLYVYTVLRNALSAAPVEVLYSEIGILSTRYQAGLTVIDIIADDGGCCDLGREFGKDGQQVKVIVTKPVSQKRLTIESKAKKVDKEGSGEDKP